MWVVGALLPEALNPKALNPLDFAWQGSWHFNSVCSFRMESLDTKVKIVSLTFMSYSLNSLKRLYGV